MAGKAIVSFEGSAKLLSDGVDGLIVRNGDVQQMADSVITFLKNIDYLVAPRDSQALAEKIIYLLQNERERIRWGKAAFRASRRYPLAACVRNLERVYQIVK